MPFVPSYTHAPQRQAFANRLAYHLAPTPSRQSLMALQEAFAKAGGFPDMHAAKVCWQKQSMFQQLMGGSPVPEESLMAFRFLGVGPAKLFQWAKESRKKHRLILQRHPFALSDAEELLTALWKHRSWNDALSYQVVIKSSPEDSMSSYLMTAPTLDDLHEKSWKITAGHTMYGRTSGLYSTWGKRVSDQHWVGQIWANARSHALLVQDNPHLRYRTVLDQVMPRLAQQDTVIVLDASPSHALVDPIVREAASQGQTVHLIDWTGEVLDSAGFFELPLAHQHHLFLNSIGVTHEAHANPLSARIPEEQGIISRSDIATLEIFEHFLNGFETSTHRGSNLFSNPIVVWKLPSGTDISSQRIRLAMGLLQMQINQKLLAGASSPETHDPLSVINHRPTQQKTIAIFSVDVPLSEHPKGMAAFYVQGRALGIVVLNAQSAQKIEEGKAIDEAKACIANSNTKVVAGPRHPKDDIWRQLGLAPQSLAPNETRIVCGGDEETIFLTSQRSGALT